MAWKKGPLPKDTYGWGGVVPADEDTGVGFYFADFAGASVTLTPGGRVLWERRERREGERAGEHTWVRRVLTEHAALVLIESEEPL